MDYKVITAARLKDYYEALDILQEKVKLSLKDGWKPQGGVSFTSTKIGSNISYIVAQAMIKED